MTIVFEVKAKVVVWKIDEVAHPILTVAVGLVEDFVIDVFIVRTYNFLT